MTNKKKMFISMTIGLALIFSLTYYLSDKYLANKNAYEKNPTVGVQNTENELDDSVKVELFAGDKKEDELTLQQLKNKFDLDEDLTPSQLSMALKEKGYLLVSAANKEITFKRDAEKGVKPNKYYIGEKDGYLAIYKTDDDGNLIIENESDVYSENKKVDNLGEGDKSKIRNFELEYDNKEDAEEDLSEFLS